MKRGLANVSPWILAAACTLLTVIIGVFAVNNYSREKKLMMETLLQKGISVIRFIDTGVRVSVRADMQSVGGVFFSWVDHVQRVIDQIHDHSDIHFVDLIDTKGVILASTDEKRIGTEKAYEILNIVRLHDQDTPVFKQYASKDDASSGVQIARKYLPRLRGPMGPLALRGRQMMERRMRGQSGSENWLEELEKVKDQEFTLLVELDMQQFDSAVERQLLQIAILSLVLLLVGIGGWLSLLTLQGYKGSQSRLLRIRAFNDMLVESLPVGLIATDAAGNIQMVNEAAEHIAEIEAEAIIGSQPADVLPKELSDPFNAAAKKLNQPLSTESIVTYGGKKARILTLTLLPVSDAEEQYVGDVALLQDMSEMRQLEAEVRRNERLAALGKMAAGVAHELRNPLSSIKGLAVLLKAKVREDDEGKKTADILVREVERLNRSISELLDYARPANLQTEQVSLKTILEKTLTLVQVDAELLDITLTLIDEASYDKVWVDADKMNQVLLNLLINAIQSMPSGGSITITTRIEKEMILCQIEDNGEGISEEDLSRVFDPYFTTKSDGTGLGLALSAKIIEEHSGEISIESRLDHGTVVTVSLPLAGTRHELAI